MEIHPCGSEAAILAVVISFGALMARDIVPFSFVSFAAMMECLTTPGLHLGMGDSH